MLSFLHIAAVTASFLGTSATLYLCVERRDVSMNCAVTHLPGNDEVLSIEWERAGGHLPAKLSYLGMHNETLVIDMFSPLLHTGDYHCRVRTRAGRTFTSNTLLLRSSETVQKESYLYCCIYFAFIIFFRILPRICRGIAYRGIGGRLCATRLLGERTS